MASPDRAPALVLDASALMAQLRGEPGAETVRAALSEGAAISSVNLAEVLSKLAERGQDPETALEEMKRSGLIGEAVRVEPLTEADAVEAARLRPRTRSQGLSLADRACLALAARCEMPAMTADRSWADLPEVGVAVRLIR